MHKIKKTDMQKEGWVDGISDGLLLPCKICKRHVDFDYIVSDDMWKTVVPIEHLRDVICLLCFDRLAREKGIDISDGLRSVQFTGHGKTIDLRPSHVFYYKESRK